MDNADCAACASLRLTNQEIAGIVAWPRENVATIRTAYVDDAAVVVALSERCSGA